MGGVPRRLDVLMLVHLLTDFFDFLKRALHTVARGVRAGERSRVSTSMSVLGAMQAMIMPVQSPFLLQFQHVIVA